MLTGTVRFHLRGSHPLWLAFPDHLVSNGFVTPQCFRNPGTNPGLGYFRFRSPLLTESMSLSFPPGTKMFQFPGLARPILYIQMGVTGLLPPSFLIQKSPDHSLFAGFPRLIAGYHVFRRLSMPRHPPCTLSSLTTFIDHRLKDSCQLVVASCQLRHPAPFHPAPAVPSGVRDSVPGGCRRKNQ
jgi:hypothetical protein